MTGYSTREAARRLGLPSTTLAQYIARKKIPVPQGMIIGGVHVRAWSDADIERVRKVLPNLEDRRKTRYKRKKDSRK